MARNTITAPTVTRWIGAAVIALTAFDSLPFGVGGFGGVDLAYTQPTPIRQPAAPAARRKLEAPRA